MLTTGEFLFRTLQNKSYILPSPDNSWVRLQQPHSPERDFKKWIDGLVDLSKKIQQI